MALKTLKNYFYILFIFLNSSLGCLNSLGQEMTVNPEIRKFIQHLSLEDKQLISVIEDNRDLWVILSGRTCIECDENPSIFILPLSDEELDIENFGPYSYPGEIYYFYNGELIADNRVFFGPSIKGNQRGVYWFQKEINDNGEWIESIYEVLLTSNGLEESFLDNDLKDLNEVLVYLEEKCIEIPGISQTVEP